MIVLEILLLVILGILAGMLVTTILIGLAWLWIRWLEFLIDDVPYWWERRRS